MSSYSLKDKVAIVTGAGSGIGHAVTELLLSAGCSVILADLRLCPEAEATVAKHTLPAGLSRTPRALFHATDVTNWPQLQALWDATLEAFGQVDVVVSIAGIYESPSSRFWNPPGIWPEARDSVDAPMGQYATIAINYVAPVRLAQLAVDHWLQHREVQGNFLAVASVAGYIHDLSTPLYMSSKAGLVSFVKSMGGLRDVCGIRFSAVCPSAVRTPLFEAESNDLISEDDVYLSSRECGQVILRVLQEPQWGDGSIVETQNTGTRDKYNVDVRDVHLEILYPKLSGRVHQRLAGSRQELVTRLQSTGMQPA